MRELKAKDFFQRGFVVVGSPKTVREQLLDGIKGLRVGPSVDAASFRLDADRAVQEQYRSLRPRGAAAISRISGTTNTRTAGGRSG